jgi:hypothetical protein
MNAAMTDSISSGTLKQPEMQLDDKLGHDLDTRRQESQDACEYHNRELARHQRIVSACSSALAELSQMDEGPKERSF